MAARAVLAFPRPQTRRALESFFSDLLLTLFDASSVNEKLLGHIKLYCEGNFKTIIRANVTTAKESSRVEIRGSKPEKRVKVWLNVIAYKLDENTLRKGVLAALASFCEQRHVELQQFEAVRHPKHF